MTVTFSATLSNSEDVEIPVDVEAHILPAIGATLVDEREPEDVEIVSVTSDDGEFIDKLTSREIAYLEEKALREANQTGWVNEDDWRRDR